MGDSRVKPPKVLFTKPLVSADSAASNSYATLPQDASWCSGRAHAARDWGKVRIMSTPSRSETSGASDFPPVLTTALAAELLQVHVEYLRRMVREGRIPCHRFPGGREMRFLRDELLEWLHAQPGVDRSPSVDALDAANALGPA
jgi:excisionase family DNA binding protein